MNETTTCVLVNVCVTCLSRLILRDHFWRVFAHLSSGPLWPGDILFLRTLLLLQNYLKIDCYVVNLFQGLVTLKKRKIISQKTGIRNLCKSNFYSFAEFADKHLSFQKQTVLDFNYSSQRNLSWINPYVLQAMLIC